MHFPTRSAAKPLQLSASASWSHQFSGRRSAAGSPTPSAGAPSSTSTCPSGFLLSCFSTGHLPYVPMNRPKTDWTGLLLLVLAVGSVQFVLDQGQMRLVRIARHPGVDRARAVFRRGLFHARVGQRRQHRRSVTVTSLQVSSPLPPTASPCSARLPFCRF
jgi:hypothetical protein